MNQLFADFLTSTKQAVQSNLAEYNRVQGVLAGRIDNGFQKRQPDVARSLPFTSGAMLCAARHALDQGIACAPVSGFHHANYASAGGYCTFNGLMVTACVLHRERRVRRIGIVDCDQHHGDGTDEIIERLGAHSLVRHYSAGTVYRYPSQVGRFFDELRRVTAEMRFCDLILYQAGADPHIHDPLGGWLTTEQLRCRDAIVFDSTRETGVPLVWNLAGGYQKEKNGSITKVLEIHDNTAREWVRAYGPGEGP
jgi:acetoin utilization deacetylase AcuC-like enzyme